MFCASALFLGFAIASWRWSQHCQCSGG